MVLASETMLFLFLHPMKDIFDEAIEITKECVEGQIAMNDLEQRAEEICRWISTFTTRPMDKDDLDYILTILRQTREEALEEFMREADKMLGPSDQSDRLAKRIRALASGSEEGK
jgi:hypothetical protein